MSLGLTELAQGGGRLTKAVPLQYGMGGWTQVFGSRQFGTVTVG
jgi:hypothetical protein